MRIAYENEVLCTREEAWQLITDFERRPSWIPFMERCYITDKKAGWIGTRYQEKEVIIGIPVNINYEIIAWDEMNRISSKCLMLPFYPHVNVYLRDIPDSDKILSGLEVDIEIGPFRFMPKSILRKQIDLLFSPLVHNYIRHLEANTILKKI